MKASWSRHEQQLIRQTRINQVLLRKLLISNAGKRIDWMKYRSLGSLILVTALVIILVIPRIQLVPEPEIIIGIILFGSMFILSYYWAVKLHLRIEGVRPDESLTSVRKQLKSVERYKLKITRYNFILAPFMITGIFLSLGIPFLSSRMVPFYALCILVFLASTYVRNRHGMLARIRKIDRDLEEISKLELDSQSA